MNTVVAMKRNARDWKYFDKRLTELRVNDIANIIERGRVLIEAKEELPHGSFEATVTRHFGMDVAQRLMKITRHSILSNADHDRHLPPSWQTLYELTKLPHDILLTKLKDGSIHPKMERKDARALRDEIEGKAEIVAAIKANPDANQRDAAKTLGISLGVYQRLRRRVLENDEDKPSAKKTSDKASAKSEPETKTVPVDPRGQRDEMRHAYVAYLRKYLTKDEQIEEIQKMIRRELGWTTDELSKLIPMIRFRI
jgi:transposase